MRLILIRHGESEHNISGTFDSDIHSTVCLTENGTRDIIEASKKVSNYLKDNHHISVSRIFCSPLYRTVESAKYFKEIVKDAGLYRDDRLCIDYKLREIDMGTFDKKKIEDYPYGSWFFEKNKEFGGETTSKVYNRVVEFYGQLNDYNTNVVVSHGEPIRQMYRYVLTNVLRRSDYDIKPKKAEPIIIDTLTEQIIFL